MPCHPVPSSAPQWDVFCRVIDNHGDVGVCWRLAADLASRGQAVRLWIDDAAALAWMAPRGAAGVCVLPWPVDPGTEWGAGPPDRVVEAFGCELPPACLHRMAAMRPPPVWINLEYLSAEGFVERSHGLASPVAIGPAAGLRKWFFFPGFTERTGGLIRELAMAAPAVDSERDADVILHRLGLARRDGERVVSLFCYDAPALDALLDELKDRPTLLLATSGFAAHQAAALLGTDLRRGCLRAMVLPWLTQQDYDALLQLSDLNFVRGEDSFVRAIWAGKPFVWQPYRQPDGAHRIKLDAFLDRLLAGAAPSLAERLRRVMHAWCRGRGEASPPWPALPAEDDWQQACEAWRAALLSQSDLGTRLIRFAAEVQDQAHDRAR